MREVYTTLLPNIEYISLKFYLFIGGILVLVIALCVLLIYYIIKYHKRTKITRSLDSIMYNKLLINKKIQKEALLKLNSREFVIGFLWYVEDFLEKDNYHTLDWLMNNLLTIGFTKSEINHLKDVIYKENELNPILYSKIKNKITVL